MRTSRFWGVAGNEYLITRNSPRRTATWCRGVSGIPWIPDLLFADSEVGVWYDPSDSTTLWQDTSGTTPAVADDPVGRIDDKSGNGNNALQGTAAKRPILRTAGGLWFLDFDGVDDLMDFTNPLAGTVAHSVFCAFTSKESSQTSTTRYLNFGVAASAGEGRAFTTELAIRCGSGFESYVNESPQNTTVVVSSLAPASPNVTNNRTWLNATEESVQGSTSRAMNTIAGASITYSDNPTEVDVYGVMVVAEQKSDDRADAEIWLAAKAGVSL